MSNACKSRNKNRQRPGFDTWTSKKGACGGPGRLNKEELLGGCDASGAAKTLLSQGDVTHLELLNANRARPTYARAYYRADGMRQSYLSYILSRPIRTVN